MRRLIDRPGLLAGVAAAAVAVTATPALAQDGAPVAAQDATPAGAAAADTAQTEVVVTATKRGEELSDVAGSVSVVSEQNLQALNAQSLSDYITRVPGVVFNDYQPGVSEVVIRGIASSTYHEANQATTGYYLNQIPLIEPGFPLVIPDVDSFDVKQVEVLRGPQGTLFGSSSLGGAVNYVVNEADPSRFDLGFEGLGSSTRRSGEANYAGKAMVNLPLVSDRLAVRVVALQRYDAGYLDNIGTGERGSNDLRVRGLRGSIVWTPATGTTVSALSMYQEYDLDDQTYALFSLPRFQRSTNVDEYQDTDFFLNSLRLDQDLGFATLTAVGSHTEKNANLAFDDSVFLGIDPRTNTAQLSGSRGTSLTDYGELRLASSGPGPFTWLIGGNYTHLRSRSSDFVQIPGIGAYIAANPGQFGGLSASAIAPDDQTQRTLSRSDVREIAVFGEASYTLSTVTLTVGGRYFEYRSRPRLQFLPNAALIPQFDYQPGSRNESDFIPKVSLSWKPSERVLLYGLYSEGFRIGGINVYSVAAGTPLEFRSDKTINYEVGARFDLVPNAFSVDIAAYHIDWNDIQARLFVPVTFQAYTTNGGGADVDGVELTLTLRPTRELSFSSSVSYNDARLSSLLPDTFAAGGGYAGGSRLPGSSEWTISNQLSLQLSRTGLRPSINVAHRYQSKAPVAFGASLQRGDFHIVDLNASVHIADRVQVGAFAKNLFNQYGILNAPFSFAGSLTRPRTIGGSLRFSLD